MLSRRTFLLTPSFALLGADPDVRITYDGSAFRVTGWTPPADNWGSIFQIYAAADRDLPPVLGNYSIEAGCLTFRPRFPLAPGTHPRAVLRIPGRPPIEANFEPAIRQPSPTTRVENVYPTARVLPANLLKFYIQFSGPMQRGEAWQRLRLVNAAGKAVDLPFLELDQELWDPTGRRLTVLFDPGRIKRGVLPREEEGAALTEGAAYTLVVDRSWKDQNGAALGSEYRKDFRVAPEDRRPIDIHTWQVQAPQSGTTAALTVDFGEPLDYALLAHAVEVHGSGGRIRGSVSVESNETRWRFVPDSPWKPGEYKLQVDTALEDVAGNRVGRPFDVDTFDTITVRVDRKTESLAFRIRPN